MTTHNSSRATDTDFSRETVAANLSPNEIVVQIQQCLNQYMPAFDAAWVQLLRSGSITNLAEGPYAQLFQVYGMLKGVSHILQHSDIPAGVAGDTTWQ